MSRQAGFSLVEILVATFVFSLVSAIAVSLMAATMTAQDVNEAALERAEMIDRLRVIFREDIGQIADRSLRDDEGYTRRYIFAGDNDGIALAGEEGEEGRILSFVRYGRVNPGLVRPRGSLVFVEYIVRDDSLIRRTRDYADLSETTLTSEQVLLSGMEEIELGFFIGGTWRFSHISTHSSGSDLNLPPAVRLRYELPGLGEVEHVVLTLSGLSQ